METTTDRYVILDKDGVIYMRAVLSNPTHQATTFNCLEEAFIPVPSLNNLFSVLQKVF